MTEIQNHKQLAFDHIQSSIVNSPIKRDLRFATTGFAGLGPYRFVPFTVSMISFIAARYS
jgi:hypothetical protein